MSRAFTIYWTSEGWSGLPQGTPIQLAGGSGFKSKIDQGSRVYITNVLDGQLRLMGGFTVKDIVVRDVDGKPPNAIWDAREYLIAEDGTSAPLSVRPIPMDLVRAMRFVTRSSVESSVSLDNDNRVNGQAMRSVRELTPDSAQQLEVLLNGKADTDWSSSELRAAVVAYLDMAAAVRAGQPIVEVTRFRELALQFGRTEKAFEYRMQNISYVLSLMGRDWLTGLMPAKNVGAKVAAQIEQLVAEVEGRPALPKVGLEILVREAQKAKPSTPPAGNLKPSAKVGSVTVYERDAKVKAWVLQRASGRCEACQSVAPFVTADDSPFLEVHHIRQLADGGSDKPSNAVALCPNCHRRLHYGKDGNVYREGVFESVRELIRE